MKQFRQQREQKRDEEKEKGGRRRGGNKCDMEEDEGNRGDENSRFQCLHVLCESVSLPE